MNVVVGMSHLRKLSLMSPLQMLHTTKRKLSSVTAKNHASLESLLELVPQTATKFITKNLPAAPVGSRGTFGGTLVAQSLLASLYTVPTNFVPTSLRCYFINGGDPTNMITYQVEKLRDGRNFIHRQIRAYQHNKLIFQSMILFSNQRNSNDAHDSLHHLAHLDNLTPLPPTETHQDAASLYTEKIIKNGNLQRYAHLSERFLDTEHLQRQIDTFETGPMEYQFPKDIFYTQNKQEMLKYYVRIRQPIIQTQDDAAVASETKLITPETDARYNYVAFAYLSDSYLLLTLPYFHELPLYSHNFSVSLDHTVYFHQLPAVNDWIFLRVKSVRSHWDKHLVQGEYYDTRSGDIVASVSQEGLVSYDSEEAIRAKF
ncbi:hypothetical protein NCAS_0D01710 [Naumovozyma castellii]|uniref:Acyl-CoA thioesterase II n=1 Tax=Naumovozyma castellii TaxID=27288 RepID=G0VDW2_NAUCA|nr:hypothetical protein NCAS_0D01710 [Naumovozyma castellii CBS 4309]CCC69752.1 hypothetical protein NCAS_0D01710 [Naumovozyma castellii CBS 4309]